MAPLGSVKTSISVPVVVVVARPRVNVEPPVTRVVGPVIERLVGKVRTVVAPLGSVSVWVFKLETDVELGDCEEDVVEVADGTGPVGRLEEKELDPESDGTGGDDG